MLAASFAMDVQVIVIEEDHKIVDALFFLFVDGWTSRSPPRAGCPRSLHSKAPKYHYMQEQISENDFASQPRNSLTISYARHRNECG